MMALGEAAALLPEATVVGDAALRFARVHTDTRTLRAGDLFVALRGERFDGHDYLAAARAAGAVAAIAEHGLAADGPTLPGLQVPDALAALQQLAAGWRGRYGGALIAVSGSNGKTTVTQMGAAILRAAHGEAALATAGNLNNHIGVPLTLLRLRPQAGLGAGVGADAGAALPAHVAAIVELGMNHAGEIAQLAAIARPTVALVNNAQREHQEFMAGVEAVARENGSVITALPHDGTAVFPAHDAHTPLWRALAGDRACWTFALDDAPGEAPASAAAAAAARGTDVTVAGHAEAHGATQRLHLRTPAGSADLTLHVPGRHNALNALAAAACTLAAGVPLAAVVQGLQDFRPVAGRSALQPLAWRGQRALLLDDSYNANPDSVRAAIELLAALPGPRWLVLGDMGEVGTQGPAFHAEVGAHARALGIETVWTAGALSAHAGATRHFADVPALLAAMATPGDAPDAAAIAVKGSRFMRMERVVQALQAQAAQPAQSAQQAGTDAAAAGGARRCC